MQNKSKQKGARHPLSLIGFIENTINANISQIKQNDRQNKYPIKLALDTHLNKS